MSAATPPPGCWCGFRRRYCHSSRIWYCTENARKASLRYIQWLRALVDAISLRKVDFAAAFAVAPTQESLYQEDGMHPSAAGSRVMADAVIQALATRNM